MIQIDNPRIYHKDEKYRGMGYEPDVKIDLAARSGDRGGTIQSEFEGGAKLK